MRVWIFCTGEPVPFLPEESGQRFLRAGKLAQYLHKQGHEVTWWTARFDHYQKQFRPVAKNCLVRPLEDGPNMIFLESCGYQRHIGPKRFFDHWQIGRVFRKIADQQEEPDIIIASFPLIELCYEVVNYGKKHSIPTVIDIRDLWPDIIYERLKEKTRFSIRWLFRPYERKCQVIFQQTDHVIGITKGMQEWCYDRFGRSTKKKLTDGAFRQFKTRPATLSGTNSKYQDFWKAKGVDLNAPVIRCVWSGSLIRDSDGPTLLKAIQALPDGIENKLQIIIAGDGSLVPDIQAVAAKCPVLKYVGWIGSDEMNVLLEESHIGLLCYLDRFDFNLATPNKVIDYCAAGLRILTNLSGEVASLSPDPDYIIPYRTGDARNLASLLQSISDDPKRFYPKSDVAHEIFNHKFDAEKVLPAITDYLERHAR